MVLVNDKYISVRLSKSGLRKKNRNLSVLMEINNFLSTALKLQEVLDGALLKVLKYFGFKTGRLYLLDEAGQSLLLAASTGIDPSGLRIEHRENGKFHIFSVSDDGVRISCDDARKLFEPFYRHTTSAGTEGAGLGLAIVREIAQRHRGDAWLGQESEGGAIFYISIAKDLEAKNP
jgi:signal transduction histidine kinase